LSLAEKQRQILARYALIEDAHERLAAVTARGAKWPAPAAPERTDAALVPGCTSRVWLVGERCGDVCHFRMDADSPLVKGLVALLCEIYDGATPAEILATEPEVIAALGFDRMLSPTRLHGLAQVRAAIREFAARPDTPPPD
jgi:cysteine desulfuration protein SufE